MSRNALLGLMAVIGALGAAAATATPTTHLWNPSTDVQPPGVWHLGIDNYFSVVRNARTPVAFPTDVGLTYGLGHGLEVGVDLFEPSPTPLVFNAKWALPESGRSPALAVGVQAVGTTRATQGNIAYGVLSRTFGSFGRATAGAYLGRRSFLGADHSGVILAWDRSFGDRWWAAVDYAGGNNPYGALALGAAYRFTPKIGLIVGYVFPNDRDSVRNDTVTTQLDIDW